MHNYLTAASRLFASSDFQQVVSPYMCLLKHLLCPKGVQVDYGNLVFTFKFPVNRVRQRKTIKQKNGTRNCFTTTRFTLADQMFPVGGKKKKLHKKSLNKFNLIFATWIKQDFSSFLPLTSCFASCTCV